MGFSSALVVGDSEKWECSICLQVVQDAVETPCEHLFCRECLAAVPKSECPNCRQPFQQSQLKLPHRLVREQLSQLKLRCIRGIQGCEVLLPLSSSSVADHEHVCPFVEVQCGQTTPEGIRCPVVTSRSRLPQHQQSECSYAHVGCTNEGCQAYVARKDRDTHPMSCSFQLLGCENCGGQFQRRQNELHERVCPNAVVVCANAGCMAKILRKDVQDHAGSCEYACLRCSRCQTDYRRHETSSHDCIAAIHKRSEMHVNGIFQFFLRRVLPNVPPIDWTSPTLSLTNTRLDQEQMQILVDILQSRNVPLHELEFRKVDVDVTALASNLLRLPCFRDLKCLRVSNVVIDSRASQALTSAFHQLSNLQHLHLEDNSLSDEATHALFITLKHNHLTHFSFKNNRIDGKGAELLAIALQYHILLDELYLENNSIHADGARAVAMALEQHGNLRVLSLSNNSLGDEGVRAVAEALRRQHNLQELYLSNNLIGDEGARAVASAVQAHDALRSVSLANNSIGIEAARALQEQFKTRIQGLDGSQAVPELLLANLEQGFKLLLSEPPRDQAYGAAPVFECPQSFPMPAPFSLRSVELGTMAGTRTARAKYTATKDTEPNLLPCFFISITAMPEYAQKSLEELRFEHYRAEGASHVTNSTAWSLPVKHSFFGAAGQNSLGFTQSTTDSLTGAVSCAASQSMFGVSRPVFGFLDNSNQQGARRMMKAVRPQRDIEQTATNMHFKVLLVGDLGVGKTTHVQQMLTGAYEQRYIASSGVEVHPVRFETSKGEVLLDIWDFAGHPKHGGVRCFQYFGANAAILMFDLTSCVTYEGISEWRRELPDIPTVLVGNKADVDDRDVEDANNIECRHTHRTILGYYDMSSKSKYNVQKPWLCLLRHLLFDPSLTLRGSEEEPIYASRHQSPFFLSFSTSNFQETCTRAEGKEMNNS